MFSCCWCCADEDGDGLRGKMSAAGVPIPLGMGRPAGWETVLKTTSVTVVAKSATHPWYQRGSPRAYAFNGDQPSTGKGISTAGMRSTLILRLDHWYRFKVETQGHPFHLSTSEVGGTHNQEDAVTKPIEFGVLTLLPSRKGLKWMVGSSLADAPSTSVNPLDDRMQIWSIPDGPSKSLYIQCSLHEMMGVRIEFTT